MWHELTWNEDIEAHIARHNIVPGEVEEVLGSHPKKYLDGRNEIKLVFGTTNAGRYAMVVLAEASDGREMVVTARDLNIRERRSFQTT